MTKISEILGLNADNQRAKTQNTSPQTAQKPQNTPNPQSNPASQPQNDGSADGAPRSLVTIPTVNRASDTTRFEVTEQKDKDGKVVTPAQDIRIGHINTITDPANTAEDRARANDERLLQIAQDNERAKQTQSKAQTQHKRLTYTEMLDKLYPEQAEARRKADEERTARKRKRDAVISALGDGLTTIANLGSVIGGANPVAQDSMSERTQQRYDKIKADADARRDAYRAARLRAIQADQEREDALAAAERSVKQHADDARREDAYRLASLNTQREIAGLRTQTQKEIAAGNWATRKYASDKSFDGRVYAANHKSSGGGSSKYIIPIYNEYTGKLDYIPVTGNKAVDYLQNAHGQDNTTHTTEDDGFGGKKEKDVKTHNGNKSANAEKTKAAVEAQKNKQKSGKGGKIPGTRQAKGGKTQVGPQ